MCSSDLNGTPQELKDRADNAGAVTLVVAGGEADAVSTRLAEVAGVRRVQRLAAEGARAAVRAFPDKAATDGHALAAALAEFAVKQGWKIEQLQTEEGKLDDVFRSITLPDTHVGEPVARRVA